MENKKVILALLCPEDREWFITENQKAFRYGATEEFGMRDDHFEEDGEIISRKTIEQSIDAAENETYCILSGGKRVGGAVLKIDRKTNHNELELFFICPAEHGKGLGYAAWQAIEAHYPQTEVWETCTPYFEKRNIHFYINKCGFRAVEFFNARHPDPMAPGENEEDLPAEGPDEMFRFEKVMK